MQLTNSYYYFKEAITPELCKKIINLGKARIQEETEKGNSVEAYTFGDLQKGAMTDSAPQGDATLQQLKEKGTEKAYARDSDVAWLSEKWIYDILTPYVDTANKYAGWNWQWDYCENLQFTVYREGGFYSWHKDGPSDWPGSYQKYIHGVTEKPLKNGNRLPENYVIDPKMVGKVRKISMTVNLNSPGDYEGGDLKFDFGHHTHGEQFHVCEEIRPQGSIIVFPSFVDHCVTPVTKGTRYSLVMWILGKPFK
jgi:Rps23 Pro-64 3,4-dihydroxylase Tpa1-like proline 4-hydroxylase